MAAMELAGWAAAVLQKGMRGRGRPRLDSTASTVDRLYNTIALNDSL